MVTTQGSQIRWTTTDLELFPDDSKRYEIIDGELFVTRSPHIRHQQICVRIATQLEMWSKQTGLGITAFAPGIIFTEGDNVIPDLIWVSHERLAEIIDDSGHLTGAPELIIEVLSPVEKQEKRDRQLKLKLYSVQGVQEYWIVDRYKQEIEIYHRENAILKLKATLFKSDTLTSSLLPQFSCAVQELF